MLRIDPDAQKMDTKVTVNHHQKLQLFLPHLGFQDSVRRHILEQRVCTTS